MSFSAVIADPLTGPVPDGWEAFVERQRLPPMWRTALLRADGWCASTAASVGLVHEHGGVEPAALFQCLHHGARPAGRFVRPGRLPAIGVSECRGRSNASPGVAFAADLDPAGRVEACRVFERALRTHAGRGQLAFGYRPLGDSELSVVPRAGRLRVRLEPAMVLRNEWSDLDGYLAGLAGKWRYQLRKIRNDVDGDDDVHVELADRIDPQEACWLAEVVVRRHRARWPPHPPRTARYFHEFGQLDSSGFLTYRSGTGRLLAYVGLHDDGRAIQPIWWGSRGQHDGRRRNLYFDQYLRLVEMMISRGRHALLLGPGLAQIKRKYGAVAEPRWGLVGRW